MHRKLCVLAVGKGTCRPVWLLLLENWTRTSAFVIARTPSQRKLQVSDQFEDTHCAFLWRRVSADTEPCEPNLPWAEAVNIEEPS